MILTACGEVDVYNIGGALVARGHGDEVDVAGLQVGVYVVKARFADGSVLTKKIVIR